LRAGDFRIFEFDLDQAALSIRFQSSKMRAAIARMTGHERT